MKDISFGWSKTVTDGGTTNAVGLLKSLRVLMERIDQQRESASATKAEILKLIACFDHFLL